MPSGHGRLESIQAIRFLASTMVVVYHSSLKAADYHPISLPAHLGAIGVDIFFVISGFVMVYITADRAPSVSSFLVARIVRIVPLYWFFTTLLLCGLLFAPHIFKHITFNLTQAVASFLFLPAASPVFDVPLPVLIPGWTL